MGVMTLKHGAVTGKDATGTPITKNLTPGPGNFSHDPIQQGCVESVPVYNRGTYLESVEGQQQAVNFSIELYQDGKVTGTAGASASPGDMVLKQGDYASGVTTDPGSTGGVWMTTIVLTITRNGVTSTCTLTNCRCTLGFGEDGGGNKLSISGTAYGTGSTLPVVWS